MRWLIIGIAGIAVASAPYAAQGDKPAPPESYAEMTPGGKYIFVMLAPQRIVAGSDAYRAKYPASGMYLNDGSLQPQWTVNWYAFKVEPAGDGVHLIRHGPWASSLKDEAISFFANGALLKRYAIDELVGDTEKLERSASHFRWKECASFDQNRMRFELVTLDQNRFVFDLRNGGIVIEDRRLRRDILIRVAVGLAVVGFVLWLVYRRRVNSGSDRTSL